MSERRTTPPVRSINGGGGDIIVSNFNSEACIFVSPAATDLLSGQAVQDAYADAKTRSPFGNARSQDNRMLIVLAPGLYKLASPLVMDSEFVDLIGLDRDSTVLWYDSEDSYTGNNGTIMQTAANVRLREMSIVLGGLAGAGGGGAEEPAAYFPDDNLPNTVLERVALIANVNSQNPCRNGIEYSGTYIDVEARSQPAYFTADGAYLFGVLSILSGAFLRCRGGSASFGAVGTCSGTFTDCEGGDGSFGGYDGTMTGAMRRCKMTGTTWGANVTGLIEDSILDFSAGSDATAILISSTARIYNTIALGSGAGKSIDVYSGAANAKIAHCRLNKGIGGSVTNQIGTPYNVDDADVT
jgi:hypothetical protein